MSRRELNFIVINTLPKEWSDKWYEMVPGGRFADAAELKGVSELGAFFGMAFVDYLTGIRFPGKRCFIIHDRRRHDHRRWLYLALTALDLGGTCRLKIWTLGSSLRLARWSLRRRTLGPFDSQLLGQIGVGWPTSVARMILDQRSNTVPFVMVSTIQAGGEQALCGHQSR